ncbi:hypothetical protein [Pseudonocardia hydrocarbonoxydans]|uniref:hypothetical protein n=1 Tax=Pseudonocardia hydrocarbonoxydans TaxID=76726 RepID=UPI0031D5B626
MRVLSTDVVLAALAVLAVAAPVAGLAALARRVRRRGAAGGYSLMGPFDELWHPAAVAARVEVQVQAQRQEPSPAPGDGLLGPLPHHPTVRGDLAPAGRPRDVDDRHDQRQQRDQGHTHRQQQNLHATSVPAAGGPPDVPGPARTCISPS